MKIWMIAIDCDGPEIDRCTRLAQTREKAYEIAKEMVSYAIKHCDCSNYDLFCLEENYKRSSTDSFGNWFLTASEMIVEQ